MIQPVAWGGGEREEISVAGTLAGCAVPSSHSLQKARALMKGVARGSKCSARIKSKPCFVIHRGLCYLATNSFNL